MSKKLTNNKIAKGIASLVVIIVLLSSILAASIFYQNNITANVVKETSINDNKISMQITAVNDIKELSQLNEGWYQIRNGFVFYLETFNSYVPLYIKVLNPEQQNGLLLVEADGKISFDETFRGLHEKEIVDGKKEESVKTSDNTVTAAAIRDITGDVTSGQSVTKANIFQRWWCSCFYYLGNKPLKENEKFWDSKGNEYTVGILAITGFDKETRQPIYVDDVSKLPPNDFYVSKPQEEKTALLPEVPLNLQIKNIRNEPELSSLIDFTYRLPQERRDYINLLLNGILEAGNIDNKGNFKGQTIDGRPVFIPQDGSAVYYPEADDQGKLKWIKNEIGGPSEILATQLPKDFQDAIKLGKTDTIDNPVKYKDPLTGITVYGKPSEEVSVVDSSGDEHIIRIPTQEQINPVPVQTPLPTLNVPTSAPSPASAAPAPGPSSFTKFYDISGTRELTTQPASGSYIVEYVGQNKREVYDGTKLMRTEVKEGGIWKLQQDNPTPKSYDIFSNNQLVTTITANSDQEAKDKATFYGLQNVRISQSKTDVTSSNLQQYYISVALANGITIPLGGKDYDDAVAKANKLATDSKTEVVSIEPTKFIVKDATNPGSEYVIEGVANANIARKTAETTYGIKAGPATEQKPFAKGGGQTYLITLLDNDNKPIKTIQINAKDEDEAYNIATNHLNTNEQALDYTLERKISLEEFKKLNPGIPSQILDQAYKQKYIQKIEETPKEKQVALKPIVDEQGNSIAWVVDSKLYTKESEARAKFNEIIAQNEAKVIAKEQKLTLLKETNLAGRPLAKDSSGNIYELIDKDDKRSYVKTNEYTVYEEIKKDDKILVIWTVYKRDSEEDTYQQVKIQVSLPEGGKGYLFVDPESAKEIKEAFNKGLVVEGEGKSQGANYISFITIKDKEGKVLSETTLIKSDKPLEVEGTKTTEKFGTAYYYNGNEITKADADKLKPEEKSKVVTKTGEEFLTFKVTEEKENGKLTYLTTYNFDTIFDKDNKPIRTYDAVKTNQQTGEVSGFIYGEIINGINGQKNEYVLNTQGGVNILDVFSSRRYEWVGDANNKEALDRANTHFNQYVSRQFFANVERVFTEFQGLGYYSTLFFSEDSLLKWRDNVDRAFATLYLGTEYWSSAICGNYINGENEGIAYAETPQGLAQVAAHIEATRTEQIIDENGNRFFIYKITFNVRNGDFDKDPRAPSDMSINVVLKGERTITLFRQNQNVKRGSTFGMTGRSAIAKTSSAFYNEICLTFDKVPLRWKISNNEICNTIQESAGTPTAIGTSAGTSTPAGTGGGTGDTNDI